MNSFTTLFIDMEHDIKTYDMTKWEDNMEARIKSFHSFLWYAFFLFQIKSKQACKYFEYCLQLRPLNGYLHYLYSLYLFKIIQNYRLSYFHLKMANKLNVNIFILRQSAKESGIFDKEKINAKNTIFQQLMQTICIRLQKQHKCDYDRCNKVLKTLNTCSGCRCVFYCSKICQKRDWKQHKVKCISTFTKEFDKSQLQTLQNFGLFLNHSVKTCVSQMSRMRKLTESIQY